MAQSFCPHRPYSLNPYALNPEEPHLLRQLELFLLQGRPEQGGDDGGGDRPDATLCIWPLTTHGRGDGVGQLLDAGIYPLAVGQVLEHHLHRHPGKTYC